MRLACRGLEPDCSSIRCAAVSTSAAAGDRGASPLITSRGGPLPPMATRLIAATTWNGSRLANRCAPMFPYASPSVDRKTIVCAGRIRAPPRDSAALVWA